jgi:hypothetical protein
VTVVVLSVECSVYFLFFASIIFDGENPMNEYWASLRGPSADSRM